MNRPTLRGGHPRLNLLLWLFPLCFLFGGAAAQTTYTKQNSRVVRWQQDVTYAADGSAAAVKVNAFFVSRLVNTADAADIKGDNEWVKVDFDLLDASIASTNITAAGKTVSYQQLAALMRQAALDRANAAGIQ